MRKIICFFIFIGLLLIPPPLAMAQQLTVVGVDPFGRPLCMGPLGVGLCAQIQQYLLQNQQLPPPVLPPVYPAPIPQQSLQVIGFAAGVGPICAGPLGPGPCAAVAQYFARLQGPGPQPINSGQVQFISNDASMGPVCSGPLGVGPCALAQQAMLDQMGSATAFAPALPNLGSLDAQQAAIACARNAGVDVARFVACAGRNAILTPRQQDLVDCAANSSDTANFAQCAAPHLGIKLSDDQKKIAGCAVKSGGDTTDFIDCAGSAILDENLTPDQQAVLDCAVNHSGDTAEFASCSATHLLGNHATKEEKIAIRCAAEGEGDLTQTATCVGANVIGLKLNPEQQIAVQCLVSTGGQPYAAAGCIATRLTGRELVKCFTDGFGGDRGCFGDNNDLFGRNGWTARTFGQIAGGPNSFIRNPGQIWGGDNSFVRNPSQIWGGPNSFVRNPDQIWGGPNSVFHNPSQLAPAPVTLGTIGGKRICLPWC